MTIQPGQYYRTKAGAKAYVAAELPSDAPEFSNCFIGLVFAGNQSWRPVCWGLYGSSHIDIQTLIDEWREPPPPTITVDGVKYRLVGIGATDATLVPGYIYHSKHHAHYVPE